ncbi:MAG: c-type cytochrome [Gammaproteobacteria bacterium]|nr:c-type cytochrome [Gammaproteobacteria bacterium]MDD9958285.1 c-type cytochrome [Gammaproteobacteria bacterium]
MPFRFILRPLRRSIVALPPALFTALICYSLPVLAQEAEAGEQLFQTHCARCHGILGEGGEGPSLKRPQLNHAPDDDALYSVITEGIPGTGMPGSWMLSPADGRQLVSYVRNLGQLPDEPMPGDPSAGEIVYNNAGNCASCHILNGIGEGIGPQLNGVGARRNSEYLRRSVTSPEVEQPKIVDRFRGTLNAFLTVRIVSERGTYEGMRINEDAFTVQMRDLAGDIYSFEKADLLSFEKAFGHSYMPGYGAVLTETQINDVVSYLMTLRD